MAGVGVAKAEGGGGVDDEGDRMGKMTSCYHNNCHNRLHHQEKT